MNVPDEDSIGSPHPWEFFDRPPIVHFTISYFITPKHVSPEVLGPLSKPTLAFSAEMVYRVLGFIEQVQQVAPSNQKPPGW